jgi:sortase A
VAGTGKVLITVGILILLFVVYQLWGTGIYTARQQNTLEGQFERALRESGQGTTPNFPTTATTPATGANRNGSPVVVTGPTGTTTATTTPVTTTAPAPVAPPEGDSIAHIVIPKIDADYYVVNGVDESDLRKGPGHYPSTPLPGQIGNAAIAGHRTTYGAPFGRLDDLEPGDMIEITTLQGRFGYQIYDKFEVAPSAVEVLDPEPGKATLTLTTCHPPYSAAKRLIVKAELQLPPNAVPFPSSVDPNDQVERTSLDGEGLSGNTGSKTPTVLAGLLMLFVGLLWWLLFHRHPRWTTWFIGVVPFAVTLAIFYFYLERALPANY